MQEPGVSFSRYGELEALIRTYRAHQKTISDIEELRQLAEDPTLLDEAQTEIVCLTTKQAELAQQLRIQLTPTNPDHQKNAVIEIVPGVGGDESCLFVQILFDIYSKYSRQQGWDLEELDLQHGNQGGFKYLAFVVKGRGAYGKLRFESGTHKIQRISPTDSAKRMHTSAATVIVFPEIEDVEITINKADVRVDKFRSQGPGGQNVNKVETGIRLTHVPTNIVVRCEGRSQYQNLMRAWQILNSRVTAFFQEKVAAEQAQQRKEIVGAGDRSQRIRTYNYPQNRVTDFRGPITVALNDILAGHLTLLIDKLF